MRNRKKQAFLISSVIVLALWLPSCRSGRMHQNTSQVDSMGIVTKPHEKKVSFRLYEPKINTANMKVTVRMNADGRNLSSPATMKIKKDSLIQICINPVMGIEAVRMEITPKNVVIVNKIQGKFYQTDLSYLSKTFGVTMEFQDLQALLLNRLFLIGERATTSAECLKHLAAKDLDMGVQLVAAANEAGYAHQFDVDKSGSITKAQVNYRNVKMKCLYSDFSEKGGVKFPYVINVNAERGKSTGFLDITVKTAEFNKPVKFNVTQKQKYSRVDSPNDLFNF